MAKYLKKIDGGRLSLEDDGISVLLDSDGYCWFSCTDKYVFDRIESVKDFNYEQRIFVLESDLESSKKFNRNLQNRI